MIDIHSHILPELDDGSQSLEESLGLLETLKSQGVEKVVATPHFYPHMDNLDGFLACREESFARLPEREDLPQVILGAEVAYFNGISQTQEMKKLQIGDTGLLLVEMPFSPWTDYMVQDVCAIAAQTGLLPVLAHVNRYRSFGQLGRFGKTLLEQGVLFQCNADAFFTAFSRSWSLKGIEKGRLHFLGSDCHNLTLRPPLLEQAVAIIKEKLGEDALQAIAQREKSFFG